MIVVRELRKAFGANVVLDGLDLRVERGETVAVVGRSGTGKSVLLKHVAGLMDPDAGEVRIEDEPVTGASRERLADLRLRMGYVFQAGALFDSMTVGENVGLALRRRGVEPPELDERVEATLEVVGLEGQAARYPAELSGGMQKRAAVARAVAPRPEYLLYDEPTSGLDPVTTAVVDALVLRLKEELRATSVVVTHDLRSAFRVADRVALLHRGALARVGTPEEMRASDDPMVRAFVEGRAELWPDEGGSGADVGRVSGGREGA